MKASDAIAKVLSANNVDFGFELIGGMITHLVDSINSLGDTKLVSVHHEQAAAFAAGAVARSTNNKKIGLALATSGPGATNLVTGIADCWLDSIPCIFITGQVNTNELKGERKIRQQGFQELDIVSIVESITKFAYQIKSENELIPVLQKAINIAMEGRPGPVLIDIPMNLQRAELDDNIISYLLEPKKNQIHLPIQNESPFVELDKLINNAKQPLILLGGGAVSHNDFKKFQEKLQDIHLPHVASLKGSEKTTSYESYYGMIGSYGTRVANFAIQNCDLLIVLGSRLDVRQTGADTDDFARSAKIIQIDIESEQLNNRVKADININERCELFFSWFNEQKFSSSWLKWSDTLNKYREKTLTDEYTDLSFSPYKLINILNTEFINTEVQYVADVGNNQMWAAHTLRLTNKQMFHNSGGLGAMGFAIPTALGVAITTRNLVVAITGDGGAQLNIQELDIIAREQLPVLILVCNNKSLGMVRTFQELYFDGRNNSTYWKGYSSSFTEIGKAYNIESARVKDADELKKLITIYKENRMPMLCEIIMDDANECRPRLLFGNPLEMQSPKK